jgi:hypothetical protein
MLNRETAMRCRSTPLTIAITGIGAAIGGTAIAQPCTPHWTGDFNAVLGQGLSLALHDADGPGPQPPALFVGGNFELYAGPQDPRLRFGAGRWDGRTIQSPALPDRYVAALASHDLDGPGPLPASLYALASSGQVWQGPDDWKALPGKFDAALAAAASWDPDGPGPLVPVLVVCGHFTRIDGKPFLHIAAWDGQSWQPLGAGFGEWAGCLLAFDDDGDGVDSLIAGGLLGGSGGTPLGPVARWDGSAWQPYPGKFTGADPAVRTLAAFDDDGPGPLAPRLYVAGQFTRISNTIMNNISRFDGQQWLPVGDGVGTPGVRIMRPLDPDGDGPTSPVLYVGGDFETASDLSVAGLAIWDGVEWAAGPWSAVNPSSGDFGYGFWHVRDMQLADPDGDGPAQRQLTVVGELPSYPTGARPLVAWDGEDLSGAGDGLGSPDGGQLLVWYGARAMAPWDVDGPGGRPATLLIGGGLPGYLVERRDGRTYLAPANLCCVIYDFQWLYSPAFMSFLPWDDDGDGPRPPAVYAGIFGDLEGFPSQGILRLDIEGWSTLGHQATPSIDAMAVFDPDGPGPEPESLIAAGDFTMIGGIAANHIARWDGATWAPLGDGLKKDDPNSGRAKAMIAFDEDGEGPLNAALFVGGMFSGAGGITTSGIARWDGTQWSDVGGGFAGNYLTAVYALAVFDEDGAGPGAPALIAGGSFVAAGGSPALNLARWDGQEWTEVGGGVGPDQGDRAAHLAVHDDDGPGPRPESLFVAGPFESVGGIPADNLARWDGETWEPIERAPSGVLSMQVFDDDGVGPMPPALYFGGVFDSAGGLPALSLARWGCDAPPPCTADCDQSGALEVTDWFCFVALFNSADPAADCDGSGGLDLFDFLCFVNAFNGGC